MPVDGEHPSLAIDDGSERLREIIFHPHVVVARKIMNLNPLRVQFLQTGEQRDIPLRHHVTVFEPIVEDVAQKEKMLKFILLILK